MMLDLGRLALHVLMLVGAPFMLTALAVGLVVGVLQSITQINDVALSFIPKLIALLVVLIVMGPWMAQHLMEFMQGLWSDLGKFIE